MDVGKQIQFWITSSEEDFAAAESLFEKSHLRHSLFFAHLALETGIRGERACRSEGNIGMVEIAIAKIVKRYLAGLASVGIHASKGVVFGSFARGAADQWSDIDLIVIAPEFDGRRDIALIKSLCRATGADSRIEPIPCGEQEWEMDQTRPIIEVARREGVEIVP